MRIANIGEPENSNRILLKPTPARAGIFDTSKTEPLWVFWRLQHLSGWSDHEGGGEIFTDKSGQSTVLCAARWSVPGSPDYPARLAQIRTKTRSVRIFAN